MSNDQKIDDPEANAPSKRIESDAEQVVEWIFSNEVINNHSHLYAVKQIKQEDTKITVDPITDSNVYWSFRTEYNMKLLALVTNKIAPYIRETDS